MYYSENGYYIHIYMLHCHGSLYWQSKSCLQDIPSGTASCLSSDQREVGLRHYKVRQRSERVDASRSDLNVLCGGASRNANGTDEVPAELLLPLALTCTTVKLTRLQRLEDRRQRRSVHHSFPL